MRTSFLSLWHLPYSGMCSCGTPLYPVCVLFTCFHPTQSLALQQLLELMGSFLPLFVSSFIACLFLVDPRSQVLVGSPQVSIAKGQQPKNKTSTITMSKTEINMGSDKIYTEMILVTSCFCDVSSHLPVICRRKETSKEASMTFESPFLLLTSQIKQSQFCSSFYLYLLNLP